jgi:hypothetical protein
MGFLAGLFEQTVSELPVAPVVIAADAVVDPGALYRIAGRDAPTVLTMQPRALADVASVRFAVKVYTPAPAPPGGTLTIVVPAGQQIQAAGGALASNVVLPNQALGMYREWVCDTEGRWLMVEGGWS